MDSDGLTIDCVASEQLDGHELAQIVAMCELAYDEPLEPLFAALGPASHLIGRRHGLIVSHVMWVTRWLQPVGMDPLRTAYIEMVASHPAYQGLGYATQLTVRVPDFIDESYQLAALCPADTSLYGRLGWVFWRGPLYIRRDGRLLPTPDERVMILTLDKTPALDLDAGLSAEWRAGEVW
ncbi:MAG: GNAT family N-acetyltransferase [Chloroflexota bacterium]|jgi:GNAT superfamily N-acetyltransferase